MSNEYQELARKIDRLERRIGNGSRLSNSSLENSTIPMFDETGQVTGYMGRQYDGIQGFTTVSGPVPPTPRGFEVKVGPGHLLVNWLGEWEPEFYTDPLSGLQTPTVAPSDFQRVEIHVSTSGTMTGLMRDTLKTSIETPRGAEVRIDLDYGATYYVRLTTRSKSGRPSLPSALLGPFLIPALTVADLDIDLGSIGGNAIHRGDDEPPGPNKIGDLWLQTPANMAYRWEGDPGTWVPSRDQGIVQALQDAFEANARATQAGFDAIAAQSTANAAQVTASTKTTTFNQPVMPPSSGRTAGDVWIDTDDGNKRYVWNGSWVPSQIGAAAISATARDLGAITTYRQATAPIAGMITGDFWLDSDDGNKAYRYSGTSWDPVQDAAIQAALNQAATAQATADGKVRIFPQPDAPGGMLPTDFGDMWIDTDDGNLTYTWSGTAWQTRLLGNSAIEPQSLVASQVIATGTISAPLLEAIFVIANTIIAGNPTGEHTRIEATGVSNYATGDDGLPIELGRQGRGWSVRNPTSGEIVASTTDEGILSVRSLASTEPDPSFGGTLLSELLGDQPLGIVAYGKYDATGGNSALTSTELGFMELGFTAQPGRTYAMFIEGLEPVNALSSGGWLLRIRATTDGTAPSVSSTLVRQFQHDQTVDGAWNTSVPQFFLYNGPDAPQPSREIRFLLSYAAGTGTAVSTGAGISRIRPGWFWIEDIGPKVGEGADPTTGGGAVVVGGGTPPPGPGGTTRKNYVYETAAIWQRTWAQNNTSVISDSEMHQGYGDSFNGNRRSSASWANLVPMLTGATITEVSVYLESYHWWNMNGGVVRLGWHGASGSSAVPATFPGHLAISQHTFPARSYGSWINRTDIAAQLKAGTYRGISLGGADTNSIYYAKFRGAAYGRPRLRVKYTK